MQKLKSIFLIIIVIILWGGINWGTWIKPQFGEKTTLQPNLPSQKVTTTQTYVERDPITITSDFQLNNSGFPGNGTIDDPIRIEGYNITYPSGNLISVSGTTFYFCIRNNLLNGMTLNSEGIRFFNVRHGEIHNNTIFDNGGDGIHLVSSDENTIANNTLYNNAQIGGNGITLDTSENNLLINNTSHDNGFWYTGPYSDGIRQRGSLLVLHRICRWPQSDLTHKHKTHSSERQLHDPGLWE